MIVDEIGRWIEGIIIEFAEPTSLNPISALLVTMFVMALLTIGAVWAHLSYPAEGVSDNEGN